MVALERAPGSKHLTAKVLKSCSGRDLLIWGALGFVLIFHSTYFSAYTRAAQLDIRWESLWDMIISLAFNRLFQIIKRDTNCGAVADDGDRLFCGKSLHLHLEV